MFRSDKTLYRIHWLEVRIKDIHVLIIHEGRRKFNRPAEEARQGTDSSEAVEEVVEFRWSWWYTLKVKPFFVKPGVYLYLSSALRFIRRSCIQLCQTT